MEIFAQTLELDPTRIPADIVERIQGEARRMQLEPLEVRPTLRDGSFYVKVGQTLATAEAAQFRAAASQLMFRLLETFSGALAPFAYSPRIFLRSLRLGNYRRFSRFYWELGPHRAQLVIGENGAGKSSLLFALQEFLGDATRAIVSGLQVGTDFVLNPRSLQPSDLKARAEMLRVQVDFDIGSTDSVWALRGEKRTESRVEGDAKSESLENLVRALRSAQAASAIPGAPALELPIFCFFGTERAAVEPVARVREEMEFDRASAYLDATTDKPSRDWRQFFTWLRDRQELENPNLTGKPDHVDPQLEAVRRALQKILPEVSKPRILPNPVRCLVDKGGDTITFESLSSGERSLFMLAANLARRMAVANPDSPDALATRGIVLIDEIELHLHPEWQREIIPRLLVCFPNVQFIFTTHSPQVAASVEEGSIVRLAGGDVAGPEEVTATQGRDSNVLLRDAFHAKIRPQEQINELAAIRKQLDDKDYAGARQGIDKLKKTLDLDPELVELETLLDFYSSRAAARG